MTNIFVCDIIISTLKTGNSDKTLGIVIINTHSTLNSGDAGIVMAQLQFLRKHFPDVRIVMTSRTPVLDRELFLPFDVTLLPPLVPTPVIFSAGSKKIRENLINLFSIRSRFRLFKEIRRCDLVIVCGGGYFYSNRRVFPGPMFLQHYSHLLLAIFFKKPLFFFPQSYGPFRNRTSSYLMKKILRSAFVKKIWIREEISFNFLSDLIGNRGTRLEICPDMAFYLDQKVGSGENSAFHDKLKPVVALTLRNWSFPELKTGESRIAKREEYLITLVEVCRYICEDLNGSLLFITQSRGIAGSEDDRIITDEIIDRLKGLVPEDRIYCPEIENNADPLHVASILSKADLVIATRFHSAIFALSSGVPVISISYQYKSEGIMKMLMLDQFCLQISNLKGEKVISLVNEIIENYDPIKKKIEENCLKMKTNIEKTIKNGMLSFIKENKKK